MAKRKLLFICFACVGVIFLSFIIKNTKISLDKDSKYKVDIPKIMRVAHIKNVDAKSFYKDINVNRQPVPEITSEEVLVYVKSATFTQRDYDFFVHNGEKKDFVPCSDFSGIVVKVGDNVKDYEIGDKVFGIADLSNNKGACADYVAVTRNNIYKMPYSLSFKQASAIPTPALLDWFALHNLQKQGLKKGTILVDDAISEVGIMLIGLLSRDGFDVTAVDDENVKKIITNTDAKQFISNAEFLDKRDELYQKYDIVINLRHGLPIKELIKLVKPKGTFISYEQTKENRDDIRMFIIDNRLIETRIFSEIAHLVHLGKLKVKIADEFDLENIRDAYMKSLKGNINGKVVVNIN